MQTSELLKHCAENARAKKLDNEYSDFLEKWNTDIKRKTKRLTENFLSTPIPLWEKLITEHNAHQHKWYQFIEEEITINEAAVFLLENRYYPVFLQLLEAILHVQICVQGQEAVRENIADEHKPEPHAKLMQRMMQAVKSRADNNLQLSLYPSIIDRTLVFYYGYHCEPWHLVGSVFATERMGSRRVICMDKGLRRLGLNDRELAFTIIHSECDDHHANDWLDKVIIPSINLNSDIKALIAEGIAACLETSEIYLDFLIQRCKLQRKPKMESALNH